MGKSILILSGIFPPDSGGPAKFASTFQNWLVQKNSKASVLSLTDGPTQKIFSNESTLVRVSRRNYLPIRIVSTIFWLSKLQKKHSAIIANGLFIEIAILGFFRNFQYSVKIPGDIVWERARNSGLTTRNVEDFQDQKLNIRYRIFRFLFTKSITGAGQVIVPSKQLGTLCQKWGVKDERITIVHNSVDSSLFSPDASTHKMYDVISVSRLVKWKCVDEVIRACASVNASLLIVGTGPEEAQLRELAADLKGQVNFAGDVPQIDLPNLYRQAKIFVLNSNFEATSYSLLEARSCGLPSLARGGTGSDEVIHSGVDGILYDGANSQSLEEGLRALLANPVEADNYAKKGRKSILKSFDVETNYQKILDVISG